MLKRRKITKSDDPSNQIKKISIKTVVCDLCHIIRVRVASDAAGAICWVCLFKQVGMPEEPKYLKKSDKPKGWHFKKYFESDGKIYSKGVEITDLEEIQKLKSENNIKDTIDSSSNTKKRKKKKSS
jgi:hypothetical protein